MISHTDSEINREWRMSITKTNKEILFTLLDELKAESLRGEAGARRGVNELKAFTDGVIHIAELLDIAKTIEIEAFMAHGMSGLGDGCAGQEAIPSSRPISGPNLKHRLVEWAKAHGRVVGEPVKVGFGAGNKKKKKKRTPSAITAKKNGKALPSPKFVKSGLVRKGTMNAQTSDWSKVK